jgi:hypothetical protein
MTSNFQHIPYFYIIQHIPSGKLYGGAKWSSDANPSTFMIQSGYTTSSDLVNDLIKEDGLDSFKTVLILTEFEFGMTSYEYETVFLQTNDIAKDSNWLNKHNNDGYFNSHYQSTEYKENMLLMYGVDHPMKSPELVERYTESMMSAHGVKWPGQSPTITSKRDATNLELYGYKCSLQNKDIAEKARLSMLENLGVEHAMQNEDVKQKSRVTSFNNYGVDNISKTQKRREEIRDMRTGSTVWNDSVKEYRIHRDASPEPHWVIGGLPKRKRTGEENEALRKRQLGSKLYNDGIRNHHVRLGEIPDPSWKLGKIKKLRV